MSFIDSNGGAAVSALTGAALLAAERVTVAGESLVGCFVPDAPIPAALASRDAR